MIPVISKLFMIGLILIEQVDFLRFDGIELFYTKGFRRNRLIQDLSRTFFYLQKSKI